MIYRVSWFENTTPQSVFFNSLGHAKFFVQRLRRNENCRKIFLEEAEAQAPNQLQFAKNGFYQTAKILTIS